MSKHLFVSERPSLLANWAGAFGAASDLVRTLADVGDNLVWIDSSTLSVAEVESVLEKLRKGRGRGVVMSATPDVDQGAALMNIGAVGYCHVYAVAEQLRAIALVVDNGGVWLPPALMQRILALSVAAAPQPEAPAQMSAVLQQLSGRERDVATEVARGASNREIAERLEVSERTVKAHLSSTFEKLGVRDRVQLALLLHNVSID